MATHDQRTDPQQSSTADPQAGWVTAPTSGAPGDRPDTKARVQQVTNRMADQAVSSFEHTKHRVSDQIRSVSDALRKATEHLRQTDRSGLAEHAERATYHVQRASEYLRQRSARELADDITALAHRQPLWFIGGALVLGVVGARFLKSSERNRSYRREPWMGSDRPDDRSSGVAYGRP